MIPLIDIEPGMVVAGRYVVSTVDRPWLEDKPEVGAVCTALDAILDEPVLIHVADASGASDVLEAARRVSILGDSRIAPTLDVGNSNGLDYIVSTRIAVTPLGLILPKSPLPIEAARALIGEIGQVLVTSARRGLFHMFLRPSVVGIASNGGILVSGIGIDAALALGNGVIDPADYTPTAASRQDALDLIRLFYAALTGYWPAEEGKDGIPAAPRENSRIARAKALNPDIPSELDDFVSGVLTGADPGPGSVAEVLGFIDEWDAELLRYVNRTPAAENDKLFDESPASFDEATSLPAPGSAPLGRTSTASDDQVKAALVRIGITRPGTRGLAAGVVGRTTGRYAERMQMRQASSFPIGAEQIDNAAKDWDEWEPEQTYSEYSGYSAHEYDENLTTPIMNRDEPDPDTQAMDIVSVDEDEDENDTRVIIDDDEDDGSWFLGGMFETSEQQREHQLREYERERRISRAKEEEARRRLAALEASSATRREEANAASPPKQVRRLSPETVETPAARHDGAGAAAGVSGAAAGGAGHGAAAGRTSPQTGEGSDPSGSGSGGSGSGRGGSGNGSSHGNAASAAGAGTAAVGAAAVAGGSGGSGATASASTRASSPGEGPKQTKARTRKPFALLVLGLLVIAAVIIGIIVVNLNSGEDEPTATPESSAASEPADDGSAQEEPKAEPPKVDKVSALDPQGDDKENDDRAKDVISGAKGSWRTDRYNSAKFGNLKDGVGLRFDFEKSGPIAEVTVTSSTSGGKFEILDGTDPEKAKKVGEGKFGKGDDGVTVKLDEGVETDSLILWITQLPKDDGGYRAVISTVDFG